MTARRTIVALAGSTALAATALLAAPTTATAVPGCYHRNAHWWCQNVYGAVVYGTPVYPTSNPKPVGRMYTTTSWFVCRIDNGPYVGGPHPYRWVYTQADNGRWGFMKDTSIYSETNPLPRC